MDNRNRRRKVPAPEYNEEEFNKSLEEIKRKLAQEVDEEEKADNVQNVVSDESIINEDKIENNVEDVVENNIQNDIEDLEEINIQSDNNVEIPEEVKIDDIELLNSKVENGDIKLEDISLNDIKRLQDLYNRKIEDHVSDINKLIGILQKYKEKVGILKEKCKQNDVK